MDKYRLFEDDTAHVSRFARHSSHTEDSTVDGVVADTPMEEAVVYEVQGGFVTPAEEVVGNLHVTDEAMAKIGEYFEEEAYRDAPEHKQTTAAQQTAALQARLQDRRRTTLSPDTPDHTRHVPVHLQHNAPKRTNIAKADFWRARQPNTPPPVPTYEEEITSSSPAGQIFTPHLENHYAQKAQASYHEARAMRKKSNVADPEAREILHRHYKKPYVKTAITVAATLTGLYLIFGPMLPGLLRTSAEVIDNGTPATAKADQVEAKAVSEAGLTPVAKAPQELAVGQVGWLKIPKIGVSAPIVEGKNDTAMTYGIWHRPGTGNPLTDSNTVLAGHRYEYVNGPRTFYSLDKVGAGDEIEVKWGEQTFKYKIVRTFVVSKDKMYIEAPTTVPMLTVYTCTPLWTSTNRLVVQATPI